MFGAHASRLGAPPRPVSFAASLQGRFGGAMNQFGWVLLAVGLWFSAVFVGNSEFVTMLQFRGNVATTQGSVLAVQDTGSEENEEPVMEVRFEYVVDGVRHEASSYALEVPFDEGSAVHIEYLASRPEMARVRGMRVRTFGRIVALVVLFPLAGLLLLTRQLRKHLATPGLMKKGIAASGRLVAKQETKAEVNDQTVYALTFRFSAEGPNGRHDYHVTCNTHECAALEDEAEEPLVYDAADPSRAVLVDDLPGDIRVTERGGFDAGWARALLFLIAPIMSVLGLLLCIVVVIA